MGIRHVRHVVNSQNLRFQTVLNRTSLLASQVLNHFENGFHILAQQVSRIISIPTLSDLTYVDVERNFPVTGYCLFHRSGNYRYWTFALPLRVFHHSRSGLHILVQQVWRIISVPTFLEYEKINFDSFSLFTGSLIVFKQAIPGYHEPRIVSCVASSCPF